MEEGTVLVVLEALVEFVLPDNTARALEIDHLEVKGGLDEVTNEDDGTLDTCVAPLRGSWMGGVDATDGGRDDLVAGRRDGGFDLGLVRRRDGG